MRTFITWTLYANGLLAIGDLLGLYVLPSPIPQVAALVTLGQLAVIYALRPRTR